LSPLSGGKNLHLKRQNTLLAVFGLKKMIFDTHCHGYWKGLGHRWDEVHRNMISNGVLRSVQVGTDLEKSRKALELARAYGTDTWCAAGIHPTGCQDFDPNSAPERIMELEIFLGANRDKMVAVGETGLDYFHLTRGKEAGQKQSQRIFFGEQARLAIRLDLPLIIHTRSAAGDTISILKEFGIKRAVIHCFSEDPAFACELMKWSEEIYFSFSGILTYKKALPIQETARCLPLNRILVETDAPFLVPQALRERHTVNEPSFTRHVMDYLKTLRKESSELVEQTVWENSNAFFRI
jgi:TatD DNase family protein